MKEFVVRGKSYFEMWVKIIPDSEQGISNFAVILYNKKLKTMYDRYLNRYDEVLSIARLVGLDCRRIKSEVRKYEDSYIK